MNDIRDDRPLERRRDDRIDGDDDLAIAVDMETLGDIENKVFSINGFNAEARAAIRQVANRLGPGETRRLALRACRALDDAIRVGGDLVTQTRGL
jgi:hypothetical protein